MVLKIGTKNFTGNIFERFDGLEILFNNCKNKSILDLGSCDGLIAYEFARNGASRIDLFEKDKNRIKFSKRLFRDVPIESNHIALDIIKNFSKLENNTQKKYDIVLFLGLYHHIKAAYKAKDIKRFIDFLVNKTREYLGVRTPKIPEVEKLINNRLALIFTKTFVNMGEIAIWKKE